MDVNKLQKNVTVEFVQHAWNIQEKLEETSGLITMLTAITLSDDDTHHKTNLLDHVGEILPISDEDWESVATEYNCIFTDEDSKLPPTGDPNCPEPVVCAKRIWREIMEKSEMADEEENNLDVLSNEDDIKNMTLQDELNQENISLCGSESGITSPTIRTISSLTPAKRKMDVDDEGTSRGEKTQRKIGQVRMGAAKRGMQMQKRVRKRGEREEQEHEIELQQEDRKEEAKREERKFQLMLALLTGKKVDFKALVGLDGKS
ncbi:hypothetical protein HK096_005725 [Nowakowskiella sp. JEL0078]|nr:hypothetical protein HK096_005725 [Nowakowskiella sp. JEL0078]